jgi:hypothetical protein
MDHLLGLVRDGAAWDKDHGYQEGTDAWYMLDTGTLYGNGKSNMAMNGAGDINERRPNRKYGSRHGQRHAPILG